MRADTPDPRVNAAEAGMDKAYNDYFRAVMANPGMSPEENAKLRKQILDSASGKLEHAYQERNTEGVEKEIKDSSAGLPATKHITNLKKTTPGPGTPQHTNYWAGSSSSTASSPQGEATPAAKPAPETVLDGKDLASELEFSGKKKPSGRPSARPSGVPSTRATPGPVPSQVTAPVTPVTVPETPVTPAGLASPGSSDVKEIEFSGPQKKVPKTIPGAAPKPVLKK